LEEQTKKLVEIQQVDLRLAEIRRLRQELPQEMEKLSGQLRAERERLEEARAGLEALKLRRRQLERDLEAGGERVRKTQARLFEVKTNKEYQALLKEIETAKKLNSDLEEEILILMERMDEGARSLKELEGQVASAERSIQGRQKEIQERMARLDSEQATAQEARDRVAAQMDPSCITSYERVARSHGGVAVARVDGGTCQGCFVSIPPQLYNEILKGGSLIQCPFCQRFLYHQETPGAGQEVGCDPSMG
jgi:predicted  nucleic acid-binding Zn-ribbon protein